MDRLRLSSQTRASLPFLIQKWPPTPCLSLGWGLGKGMHSLLVPKSAVFGSCIKSALCLCFCFSFNQQKKRKSLLPSLKPPRCLTEGPILSGMVGWGWGRGGEGSRAGVTEVTPVILGGPGSCGRGLANLVCQEAHGVVSSAPEQVPGLALPSTLCCDVLTSLVSVCSAVYWGY